MTLTDNLARHRGPYLFHVVRPLKTKPNNYTSEWLTGEVDSEDVQQDAHALLTDPRDTISSIDVWSVREQQFVWSFRRRDLPTLDAHSAVS